MLVNLTKTELLIAWQIAAMQHTQNIKDNAREDVGQAPKHTAEAMGHRMLGCECEMAVAKWLNRFWTGGIGDFKAIDVGNIEVRGVDNRKKRLILHKRDKSHLPYVLVDKLDCQTFDLVGWILCSEGQQEKYWQDPKGGRPAYFVPRSALDPDFASYKLVTNLV